MDEITKTRLIIAALDQHPYIDSNKWFSTNEGYKVTVVDMIHSQTNHESLQEKASKLEEAFIRAVVSFLLTIEAQPAMPCSYHPNSGFDLPKCKNYKTQGKLANPSEVICSQILTLQDRLEKCPCFEEKLISGTYQRAETYISHLPDVGRLYSIRISPV